MNKKEYIVTLYDPDDWDIFHDEMIKSGSHPFVPYRPIDCSNYRPISDKQAQYMLTDIEADQLRNDPRVELVELHIDEIPEVFIGPAATQNARFDKSNTLSANMKNWGLLRSTSISNPFTGNTLTTNYNYNLSGKGVDIVVIDSGVAENHPEFAVNPDGTGGSRVIDYDWTQLGVPGVTALAGGSGINGFLGDCDGHGTNCAVIAAGNTCGWARDARIYSIRAIPAFGGSNIDIITGNTLGLINATLVFDLVKAFHLSKTPDPLTGYVRPTICTNSWSYNITYQSMQQTFWRGTTYNTATRSATYGQVSSSHGFRYSSLEISMAEAMNAGVIIIGAAGNNSHKSDTSSGIDYNNYWTNGTSLYYYHRGSTPGSASAFFNGTQWEAITVGALDTATPERKASFSVTGPRVDLYCPGVYVMGGGSSNYTNVSDPRNTTYKLSKLSGTSQATPQVAGILACLAQARPWMNQLEARNWIIKSSVVDLLDQNPSGGTGYNNLFNLQGGNNRIAYMPFNSSESVRVGTGLSGNFTVSLT